MFESIRKWFEKRETRIPTPPPPPKNNPNIFKPLSRRSNVQSLKSFSPALLQKVCTAQNLHIFFFTARLCRGSHANNSRTVVIVTLLSSALQGAHGSLAVRVSAAFPFRGAWHRRAQVRLRDTWPVSAVCKLECSGGGVSVTICHESITQLIRKTSNRVTVILKNSTRTGVPGG